MRVPITGGSPELVLTAKLYGAVGCSRSPATLCAMAERTEDQRLLTFSALDPVKGRGRVLASFDADPTSDYDWCLSPDGGRIALLQPSRARIFILSIGGLPPREIELKGRSNLDRVTWTSDGKALFISVRLQRDTGLLRVDMQGNSHVLWNPEWGRGTYGIPSPDGRYLALLGWRVNSNIWMMENF